MVLIDGAGWKLHAREFCIEVLVLRYTRSCERRHGNTLEPSGIESSSKATITSLMPVMSLQMFSEKQILWSMLCYQSKRKPNWYHPGLGIYRKLLFYGLVMTTAVINATSRPSILSFHPDGSTFQYSK